MDQQTDPSASTQIQSEVVGVKERVISQASEKQANFMMEYSAPLTFCGNGGTALLSLLEVAHLTDDLSLAPATDCLYEDDSPVNKFETRLCRHPLTPRVTVDEYARQLKVLY